MKRSAIFVVLGLTCLAAATAPPRSGATLAECWAELEQPEFEATRALLTMSSTPVETTAFLKGKLGPVKLSEDELHDLLLSLDSGDEAIWKAAFEQLRYLDPRLAMDLPKLMEEPLSPDGRGRLVAVLCDNAPDAYAGMTVALRQSKDSGDYNFTSQDASWWAEHKLSRLNTGRGWENSKGTWMRAARAIALLEHFATPQAKAILKDMTAGHPDAQPTKFAQAALDRLSLAER